jgi:hypothetical protein
MRLSNTHRRGDERNHKEQLVGLETTTCLLEDG